MGTGICFAVVCLWGSTRASSDTADSSACGRVDTIRMALSEACLRVRCAHIVQALHRVTSSGRSPSMREALLPQWPSDLPGIYHGRTSALERTGVSRSHRKTVRGGNGRYVAVCSGNCESRCPSLGHQRRIRGYKPDRKAIRGPRTAAAPASPGFPTGLFGACLRAAAQRPRATRQL